MERIFNGYRISGSYGRYVVHDFEGRRPFDSRYVTCQGEKKPLVVYIIFERLYKAREWIRNGCQPTIPAKGAEVIWAVNHDRATENARAALAGARGAEDAA